MKKIILLIVSFFTSISLYSYEIKDNFLHDTFGNSIELKKYNRVVIIDLAVAETMLLSKLSLNYLFIKKECAKNVSGFPTRGYFFYP